MVSPIILERYADLLVNFALHGGKGIRSGEVVLIQVPECAKEFLAPLHKAVLLAGGHPMVQYLPDGLDRYFYEHASVDQLEFFPGKFLKGRIETIDHQIGIIAEHDLHELEGIDPQRIMRRSKVFKPYMDWSDAKESAGAFTWTLALYGTDAMAKEANMSIEQYWEEIIKACYLDTPHPVDRWRSIFSEIDAIRCWLDGLAIDRLHIKAKETDLWVGVGQHRKWMGGSGRNIPSYEVFISPDYTKTTGTVLFTEPLYVYGNLIKGVRLRFKDGLVVDSDAECGKDVLREMIKTQGADRIGEFSLTDARHSRITRFMADTLYDENVGGEHGNMHLALGKAYRDSYPGDQTQLSDEQWDALGYNDSVVHTDIVSTSPRVVTAFLNDGTQQVIYRDGKFCIPQ